MSKDRYDVYDDNNSSPVRRRKSSSKKAVSKKTSAKRKKKKKKSLKSRFFTVLAIVLGLYCIGALSYFALQYYISDNIVDLNNDGIPDITTKKVTKPKLKERTVFAVMGVDDDGTRTDTIMVCCYNDALGELDIISVPRDTLVSVSDEAYNKMCEEFPEPGQHGMKINTIHHYGGDKYGVSLLIEELEEIIGVPIDYYIKVKFEALEYIVDSIGGVEYDVPMKMDYEDPGQDLYIHLAQGLQTLNGEQAVHLVRYRYGYDNQDLDRVKTQQDFCKVLLKKLINKDTVFSNAAAYVTTFFKYVDTDVRVSDAIKYMSVVKDFNADNVYTYTMPGDIGSLYGFKGGYILNDYEVQTLCYDIFQKPSAEIKAEREAEAAEAEAEGTDAEVTSFNDKTLTIQVLNGGYTNGKASQVQSELVNSGYNVTSIGTYTKEKTDDTRIYVKEEGMGKEVANKFFSPEIIVDPTVASDHDIVIVIGIGE